MSTDGLGTEGNPLRVAVVGSGPSGFFAADALFKSKRPVHIDMFDRLPTPFGLVRLGVAPDHPKIKAVTRQYTKWAQNPQLHFWGNVTVGSDISVDELRAHYDAVIFTCGAETDRKLGIEGEDLPGSHTATAFVGWYNGHPDYRDLTFDLDQEVAVVIGQGNVAMDVSRILAKTVDELKETDIAEHALEALSKSKVRHVYLIGRRGPAQAKFTPPEIREIGELAACDVDLDPAELVLNEASQAELDDKDKGELTRQNYEILQDLAGRTSRAIGRTYHIRFFQSPTAILGKDRVEGMQLERNALKGDAFGQWSEGTGEMSTLDCGLVLRSVGYRGVPIEGVPFEQKKGVFPNADGRVLDGDAHAPRLYAAGWIKRGPSGVIGTNKPDAQATVKAMLDDVDSGALTPAAGRDSGAVRALLEARKVRVVSFEDWEKIDAAEVERGQAKGKPREKITRIAEMLEVLG